MITRNPVLLRETRSEVRVKENVPLLWHIKESKLVGKGRVRNISTAGMLVELASPNAIPEGSLFSFDSNLNGANCIPEEGRLIWCRKNRFSADKYLCGVRFGAVPDAILSRLTHRVEEGVNRIIRFSKIDRIVHFSLSVVTVVLMAYTFWLAGSIFTDISRNNQQLLASAELQAGVSREYQRLYVDTTRRLADVTLEFNRTTALYQESQKALEASRQELAVLQSVLSQTEGLLAQTQADGRWTVPQTPVAPFAWQDPQNVLDIEQGKRLIALYRDSIHQVRRKIHQIKQEEQQLKIAALQERDRIRLLYGNQGYFVKNGQYVRVNPQQYHAQSLDAVSPAQTARSDAKVRVDVTVFQNNP